MPVRTIHSPKLWTCVEHLLREEDEHVCVLPPFRHPCGRLTAAERRLRGQHSAKTGPAETGGDTPSISSGQDSGCAFSAATGAGTTGALGALVLALAAVRRRRRARHNSLSDTRAV
jgi:MYXO-CTERM domain-containing protein